MKRIYKHITFIGLLGALLSQISCKKIEVDLEYYDFEKEIDEIKGKLENLKTLVENAEEWDKKIKDAAGEYILENAQSWWETVVRL